MDFNEKLEKAVRGLYIYYIETPLWISEWELDNSRTYSDVIPIEAVNLKLHFIAFISCNRGQINYISRVRRDKTVVTKKIRIFFEKTIRLSQPVLFNEIFENVSPQLRSSLDKMIADNVHEMTGNQWNSIITFLFRNNKDQHEKIIKLLDNKKKKESKYSNTIIIRDHEKDAIGLSLRIADIHNQYNNIASWDIETTNTPEFLKNVSTINLREDQMIINDFKFFDDWKVIEEYQNNTAVFSNGFNRVSIMNVNRTPIETTLGVDLFYYNYDHRSYVFVQYKRLLDNGKSQQFNIVSDKQFLKDLERMNSFEDKLEEEVFQKSDYRLNNEFFYFKFCKETQELQTKDLCAGMYLPKTYVEYLMNTNNLKTISYDIVKKYFNNTMFIEMVKSGFFGSSSQNSKYITEIIKHTIETGKSLIFAVKRKEDF